MSEEKTPKVLAADLLHGFAWLVDLVTLHEKLPHDKIEAFCQRNGAEIGESQLLFIIKKALEWENEP